MAMSIEIERKFLIYELPKEKPVKSHKIRQGYVSREDGNSVRVREKDGQFILSVKTNHAEGGRNELEYNISKDEGEVLFSSINHDVIEKTRNVYLINELTWEVDIFTGRNTGLIVAEIELDDFNQDFDIPEWIGPEVTELSKFYNANLANRPFDQWRVSYQALVDRLDG
ncbi:CYTH domain-containing protein [Emcibacteraceae bacterium]|nr:CYTH domain-containing protein [Emcibacteraceae bacterium]